MNKIFLIIFLLGLGTKLSAIFDQNHIQTLYSNCTDMNSSACKELQKICHLDDKGNLLVSQDELLSELGNNEDSFNDCRFLAFGIGMQSITF